jgi:hypothetical protein
MVRLNINQLYKLRDSILLTTLVLSCCFIDKKLYLYRMCRALMPGDEENMTDEAVWETLPVRYIIPSSTN